MVELFAGPHLTSLHLSCHLLLPGILLTPPGLAFRGLPGSLLPEKPQLIILYSLSHYAKNRIYHDLTFSCVVCVRARARVCTCVVFIVYLFPLG